MTGGALGGLAGLLIGIGAITIPGIGPVVAAGPLGTALASTLVGAGIGAATGGIIGALVDAGVPEEEARLYQTGVERGGVLVTARVPAGQEQATLDVLNANGARDVNADASNYNNPNWRYGDGHSTSGVGTEAAGGLAGAAAGAAIGTAVAGPLGTGLGAVIGGATGAGIAGAGKADDAVETTGSAAGGAAGAATGAALGAIGGPVGMGVGAAIGGAVGGAAGKGTTDAAEDVANTDVVDDTDDTIVRDADYNRNSDYNPS
jgi:hypothetical protein